MHDPRYMAYGVMGRGMMGGGMEEGMMEVLCRGESFDLLDPLKLNSIASRVPQAVLFPHPYDMIASEFDFVFTLSVLSCRGLNFNQLQTLPESFGNITVGGNL